MCNSYFTFITYLCMCVCMYSLSAACCIILYNIFPLAEFCSIKIRMVTEKSSHFTFNIGVSF